MGDGLGALIVGDLKRFNQSILVPLRLGEVQIVLHSHEDVAELVRDLVGLDAEDVVRSRSRTTRTPRPSPIASSSYTVSFGSA